MSYKKSNPTKTSAVLLLVVIIVLAVMELSILLALINLRSTDVEDIANGFLVVCGICIFWPLAMTYIIVAFSISLRGREVYGKKHGLFAILSFISMMVGVVLGFTGWFIFPVVFDFEVGISLWASIPFMFIVAALFLFIKDLGGLIPGLIGLGTFLFAKILFIIVMAVAFQFDDIDTTRTMLSLGILSTVISMAGLGIMVVGYAFAFKWMDQNKPLIDEQEAQQMQMQQQQVAIMQNQLYYQQQHFQLTQQMYQQISAQNQPQLSGRPIEALPPQGGTTVSLNPPNVGAQQPVYPGPGQPVYPGYPPSSPPAAGQPPYPGYMPPQYPPPRQPPQY